MNADDKAQSHRGEPQRMAKKISHGFSSSLRGEPIITVRQIVESVRQEATGIDYGRDEQWKRQTKYDHGPQMSSAAHPAVGPTTPIKVGGNAFGQAWA